MHLNCLFAAIFVNIVGAYIICCITAAYPIARQREFNDIKFAASLAAKLKITDYYILSVEVQLCLLLVGQKVNAPKR